MSSSESVRYFNLLKILKLFNLLKKANRIVKSSYRRTFLITNSPKKTTITDTPKSPIIGVKKKNKR